ncbi:hypothetical protein AYL99_11192 [Fonsecaea erecta]|uniref:AAA+ ATPase domain-containing protein n=1 Tax=Fonsecaea erecta TaxID=1367422 RepID=A0A178Z4R3_9EURO|nr:hypothetical protein AYL99_11192 [Fonsecaea erecta]OAP54744.1 hypothetical protein AYL99_11192 [Fonsecaea erecta]
MSSPDLTKSPESSDPSEKSNYDVPDEETVRHLALFASRHDSNDNTGSGPGSGGDDDDDDDDLPATLIRELEAAPLFSSHVKQCLNACTDDDDMPRLPAYGLLGLRTRAVNGSDGTTTSGRDLDKEDNLIYTNMQHPWSTFICGQQGAGKSHTMSCLLENALIGDSSAGGGGMGPNPTPMAGLVFHYDKFTSARATQICEAVYLSSQAGIKVQVLVSPSNLTAMRHLYRHLPNWPRGAPRPEVLPFLFSETQLNVANMKALMAVDSEDKNPPLYMAIVNKVLKQLSLVGQTTGIRYQAMKQAVSNEGLTPSQTCFLEMRYSLIEWFLKETTAQAIRKKAGEIQFGPGTLLIVDLSCPFVTETDACTLFSIFLQIFLGQRHKSPLIIALDEAHKFLTETPAAKAFSEDLVQIIRQQRHLATRVVIATQEPTISPKLLDLCTVAVVHQFQSPEWYKVLQKHVAALAQGPARRWKRTKKNGSSSRRRSVGGGDGYGDGENNDSDHNDDDNNDADDDQDIFKTIVRLRQGEALVFCPKAYFDVTHHHHHQRHRPDFHPLEDGYAQVTIRGRVTADGGRSILASDRV